MKKLLLIFGLLCVPTLAHAEESISRRDGFVLIWNSIARPAEETRSSYADVSEGQHGFFEISFGKRRGILPDTDTFSPDDPLTYNDALLWIYRTRNIRELPGMQQEDLLDMIADYPIVEMNRNLEMRISRADVLAMQQQLDGLLRKEVHEVSFYADDFHGRGTAFGETFDMHAITAAHRSLPHNTLVRVKNVDNGKEIVVRINDRGPYVHGRNMDLSKAAFEKIAPVGQGVLRATFERLGDQSLVDECVESPRVYQRRITKDVHFFRGVPHTFSTRKQLILQSSKPFVVLGITFPDGEYLRIQDFVLPKEKYRFTPEQTGRHVLHVGDTLGRVRELWMTAEQGCFEV